MSLAPCRDVVVRLGRDRGVESRQSDIKPITDGDQTPDGVALEYAFAVGARIHGLRSTELERAWVRAARAHGSIWSMPQTPRHLTDADAAHEMALHAAEGVGVSQNWSEAIDHLRQSAALGSQLAQAEMAWLSGNWTLALGILENRTASGSSSPTCSDPIDISKWLQPTRSETLSDKARIAAVYDFATPEMCDWLIARARPQLAPAQIYDRNTGQNRPAGMRTNKASTFPARERDLILAIVRARIAALT